MPKGGPGLMRQDGEWTITMIAILLGTNSRSLRHYLTAERYPEVRIMKRIELLFGWPASEQVALVPLDGYDMRYSMVLKQVMDDWKHNNPRTQLRQELRCIVESPRGTYDRAAAQ
jgi:hypothetical protein